MLSSYRRVLLIFLITQLLTACMTPMEAFIRNTGESIVTLEVELFGKSNIPSLPNHVKAATRILPIKASTIRRMDTTLIVRWKDTSNFELSIPAKATVDMSGVAGAFWNGRPGYDCRVMLRCEDVVDTLIDRGGNVRREKFHYKPIWFLKAAYWHDANRLSAVN